MASLRTGTLAGQCEKSSIENAPLRQEILLPREYTARASLPLATEGVQRSVWEH
jgi:hypothetical protein